jgi:hypothetical protein
MTISKAGYPENSMNCNILNFLCRNINGEFFSSDEMTERFEKQGFKHIGTYKDHYAQLVILQKTV